MQPPAPHLLKRARQTVAGMGQKGLAIKFAARERLGRPVLEREMKRVGAFRSEEPGEVDHAESAFLAGDRTGRRSSAAVRVTVAVVVAVVVRVIGRGVNAGIDMAMGKGKPRAEMTEAERSQADAARATAGRARQMSRMARRVGRF